MSETPLSTTLHSELSEIARRVVQAFPDLHAQARQAAIDLLKAEGITNADPDLIYWHRFTGAVSSSRSYTGWQHDGTPEQSMTLTELVIRRFRVGDQDNADLLHLYGGFYTAGPAAGSFNETNEVRLEPQRVLDAFWVLDFAAGFQLRARAFWQAHSDDVRTLAKLNFLSEALQAGLTGQLDQQQLKLAFDAVGFDADGYPQLEHFEELLAPRHGAQIATLSLEGQVATDVLWISGEDGHQVLYFPGSTPSFQGFCSEHEVAEWLFGWLQVPSSTEQLLRHFTAEPERLQALRKQLQGRAKGTVEQFVAHVHRSPVGGNVFAWMRDNARQRMTTENDAAMHTNAELRAQLWIGYLRVAGRLFGYMAPGGWPLALLAVAVGAASLALNVEQAIDGDTVEERDAGVLGAILAGVDMVLNLPFLMPLGRAPAQSLEDLESNVIVNVPPAQHGALTGISTLADGGQYVELDGLSYRVQFDQAMDAWFIVPKGNPFTFADRVPIRLNQEGQWVRLESACLRGGGQCLGGFSPEDPIEPVDYSPFEVPEGSYETPQSARAAVRELLSEANKRMMSGDFYDLDSPLNEVHESLVRVRGRLVADAHEFFAAPPTLPVVEVAVAQPPVPAQRAFMQLFEEHGGVVVGESHNAIASKQWLINNFKPLYAKGVRTLYLEHVMTDLHQVDLDLFTQTGRMSRNLQSYLITRDVGHFTDPSGRYTFLELVRKARANGIHIQAIDCAASYRLDGLEVVHYGNPLRQQAMNYYAHQVISARQAAQPVDKWVALVGSTHSNFYKRVPGVAELQGVPGMRIVDAGPGQASSITLDPGEYFLPSMGRPDGIVQADLRLALHTRDFPVVFRSPDTAPPGVIRPRD